MNINDITAVIVRAKMATYVGDGTSAKSSRPGSHDLAWSDAGWDYLDSYFGGTDFLGQETLWFRKEPVWAMNYYGYIQIPELINARRAGATIKAALSSMYSQGRFLGGFEWSGTHGRYVDRSEGDAFRFRARETILVDGKEAYALDYFGGLIKT